MTHYLQKCTNTDDCPKWMTIERSALIVKTTETVTNLKTLILSLVFLFKKKKTAVIVERLSYLSVERLGYHRKRTERLPEICERH